MMNGMMSESDKAAGYEAPSVTDLGNLEDITRSGTAMPGSEQQGNKT
jgi:hypothetical protein